MTVHGCNQPKVHTGIIALSPSQWGKKIPLIDLNDYVKGADLKDGFGQNQLKDLCTRIVELLSKGIIAKSEWVATPPASDTHALTVKQRLYMATINYINTINDIPNNGPKPTNPQFSGEGDEGEARVLPDEPEPVPVEAADLYKAMLFMDFIAAPEEPVPDTE
ncbi:hypothetical protein EJ08DRAFT_479879 [Tothia fuscella]|uniref:Uncharacterized protein n=1 Tax=Tothia fuscella TaxID=1048955 RepID=A0A9P4NI40_9PEZI|nr:hypothetical protein EJ08DRAFT_479879 [Tothia fuscella]